MGLFQFSLPLLMTESKEYLGSERIDNGYSSATSSVRSFLFLTLGFETSTKATIAVV